MVSDFTSRNKHNLVNLCSEPPWAIASSEFNEQGSAFSLCGVREGNKSFFQMLDGIGDPIRRGEVFNEYMSVKFNLHEWRSHHDDARRSLRNSYVRFLRGWGLDSNSIEGAVLKGWVESRIGIPPTYHRGKKLGVHEGDDSLYAWDRMRGHARTNAIFSQLDLLYEFSQYELARRKLGTPCLTLYRGTYDVPEYQVMEKKARRHYRVLMNNLSSFTSDRECAWEFGSTVWEVQVHRAKIFFFSDLLPDSLLKGEREFMVIGGEYWVKELLF